MARKPQPAPSRPAAEAIGQIYLLKNVSRDTSYSFQVGAFHTLEAAQRHADPAGTREWTRQERWGGLAYWFAVLPAETNVLEIETVNIYR